LLKFSNFYLNKDCNGHAYKRTNNKKQEYEIKESMISIFNLF